MVDIHFNLFRYFLFFIVISSLHLHGNEKSSTPLRLTTSIDGKNTIYPGQRTKLVYTYYFQGDIELVKEVLPLLDAKGLIKIGEKEFTDSTEGDMSISTISQEVEGAEPGIFSFGPSLVEGYLYQSNELGQRTRTSEKLVSEVPAITVTILPFPAKNKPISFNGAIGTGYHFSVFMKSPSTLNVGDEVSLELTIKGNENIKRVPLPELCCQPNFKNVFRVSDIPPTEESQGNTKKAVVKMRPLNAEIKEIPPVEFTYFNPSTEQYTVLSSEPIPITIKPLKQAINGFSEPFTTANDQTQKPMPIEETFLLTMLNLLNSFFGTWYLMGILPLSIALIIYQLYVRKYLCQERLEHSMRNSRELFNSAISQQIGSQTYFDQLTTALKLSLVETGRIPNITVDAHDFPNQGIVGEVRNFLLKIEENRFSKKQSTLDQTTQFAKIHAAGNLLFNKIAFKESKNKSTLSYTPLVLFLISIMTMTLIALYPLFDLHKEFQSANRDYEKVVQANTLFEQQSSLNNALHSYLDLESKYTDTQLGNGKLYYNIATTYFQLREYSLASLYYRRAYKLMPYSEVTKEHILMIDKVLNIPSTSTFTDFSNILSLPERLQLFFILTLITFCIASFYIWNQKLLWKRLAFTLSSISSILLISIGFTYYIAPNMGVLIQSSALYRDEGNHSTTITDLPIPAGTTVEILGISQNESLIKIITSDGHFGFVPQKSIRLL